MKLSLLFLILTYGTYSRANSCLLAGAEVVSAVAEAAKDLTKIPVGNFDPKFCQAIQDCEDYFREDAIAKKKEAYDAYRKKLPLLLQEAGLKQLEEKANLKKVEEEKPFDPKKYIAQKTLLAAIEDAQKAWKLLAQKDKEVNPGGEISILLPYEYFPSAIPSIASTAYTLANTFKIPVDAKNTILNLESSVLAYKEKVSSLEKTDPKSEYISYYKKAVLNSEKAILDNKKTIADFEAYLKDPVNLKAPIDPNEIPTDYEKLLKPIVVKAMPDPKQETVANCSEAEDMFKRTVNRARENKAGICGMTPAEVVSLKYYSDSGYRCMNKYLRAKGKPRPGLELLTKTLNSALSKLPDYKGIVRRGGDLPPTIRAQHEVGKIVTYDSYTSTSTAKGFSSQDLFMVFSKTGKPIMGFSSHKSEHEILFRAPAKFKVLDVRKEPTTGKTYYVMKEVLTEKSAQEEAAEDQKLLAIVKAQDTPGVSPPTQTNKNWDDWSCPLDEKAKIPSSVDQIRVPTFKSEANDEF
jgi:ADP-ribosyltransferase exoenzyme